jgi:hypothetical protein
LNNPTEKKMGQPDWKERPNGAVLALKGSRYRVKSNNEKNQYFIQIPTDNQGKPFRPARFGLMGSAWLGSGMKMSGGLSSGHANYNPADKQTTNELIDALKQGHYGEPAETYYNHVTELPSVTKGVDMAISVFKSRTGMEDIVKRLWQGNEDDLIRVGVEGLYGFTGDPAFQVGYVSDEEIMRFLKKDPDLDLSRERDRMDDEAWGGQSKIRGGNTIHAHLARAGYDEEQSRQIIRQVIHAMKSGTPLIHLGHLGQKVEQAFGKGAFLARYRAVAKHVLTYMSKVVDKARKEKTIEFSKFEKPGEEGKSRAFDPTTSDRGQSDVGREVQGPKSIVKPKELLQTGKQVVAGAPQVPPTPIAQPEEPKPSTGFFNKMTNHYEPPVQVNQQPPPTTVNPKGSVVRSKLAALLGKPAKNETLDNLIQWRLKKEMSVVYDPKVKVKIGCGFNWEGAPGSLSGTNISGDANTAKSDPTGKKNVRKQSK